MPGQDDFHAHFRSARHNRIEVVHLEPQEHGILQSRAESGLGGVPLAVVEIQSAV